MQITCEKFIFLSLIFAYVMNKDYFPISFTKIIFDKNSKQNKINVIVMKIWLYKQKSQNAEREKATFFLYNRYTLVMKST